MRTLLYVVGALISLIFVVLLAVPTVISSDAGRDWTLARVNSGLNGKLQVNTLSVGWMSPLHLEGVTLTDAKGQIAFSLAKAESEVSLFGLIRGGMHLGETRIDRPFVRIVRTADGRSNFDEILGTQAKPRESHYDAPPKQMPEIRIPMTGTLVLADGTVELQQAGVETIKIDSIEGSAKVTDQSGPLEAELSAQSAQGSQVGKVHISLKVSGFDSSGRLPMTVDEAGLPRLGEGAQIAMDASLENLPVAAVDRILGGNTLVAALGNQLNVRAKNLLSSNALSIDIEVSSPNLTGRIVGDTTPKEFRLTQPSEFTFVATPALLPDLVAPTTITWTSDRLAIPISGNMLQLSATSVHSLLVMGKTTVKLPGGTEQQTIDNLRAELDSDNISEEAHVKMTSSGVGSQMSVQAVLRKIISEGQLTLDQASVDLRASLERFPVALIDGDLVEALGGQITAAMDVSGSAGDLKGRLSVAADRLRAEGISMQWKDQLLTLQAPATVQMTATPALVRRYAPDIVLAKPVEAALDIQEIRLPFDINHGFEFQPKKSAVKLLARLPEADATIQQKHQLSLKGAQFALKGPTLADSAFELVGEFNSTTMPPAVGLPGHISCTGRLILGSIGIEDFVAQVKTASSELMASGRLDIDGTVEVEKPITMKYTLVPEYFPGLTKPAPAQLSINPFTLATRPFDLGKFHLTGSGKVASLVVRGASIENADLDWEVNVAKAIANVDLKGQARSEGQASSPLSASISASNWYRDGKLTPEAAQVAANLDLEVLPIAIAETLTGMNQLVTLIGKTLKVHLESTLTSVYPMAGTADLKADGEGFSISSALQVDGERVQTRNQSTQLNWQLTPARFAVLVESGVILEKPATVDLVVNQLAFPSSWDVSNPQLRDIILDVKGSISGLHVADKTGKQSVRFDSLELTGSTRDLAKEAKFALRGRGQPSGKGTMEMDLTGTIGNLLNDKGEFNWMASSTRLDADLKAIPAPLLSALGGFDDQYNEAIDALFGKQLNATAKAAIRNGTGTLAANLDSDNSDLKFDGRLENGVLLLNAPMTGTLFITRDLSRTVMKRINPILVTAVSANEPIRFTIEPEGFSLPVMPYDISKGNMQKATIELAKLLLDNGGPLGLLVGLASGQGSVKQMEVWFTPQYISMRNGVAKLERMDALAANAFHLCTWGTIDIPADRVDMTSGILGTTLRRSFGIQDVSDDYVLQTRMTGTTGNVEIPTTKLLAQIAAMKAGGGIGQIFGGVIGGGALQKVPNPTTTPYPWAGTFPPPNETRTPNNQQQNIPGQQPQDPQSPHQPSQPKPKKGINPLDIFKL